MQFWYAKSGLLGNLRFGFDENAIGFDSNMHSKNGSIVSIEFIKGAVGRFSKTIDFQTFENAIKSYEAGHLAAFDKLYVHFSGTDFQQRVLMEMRKIPVGSVYTYSDLAVESGNPKAFRAVATVCSTNSIPLLLPCHRVVPSNLTIGNYASRTIKNGAELKEKLLIHEQAID